MPDKVRSFTDTDFDPEVLRAEGPVVVDFFADWCAPCHVVADTIAELADDYVGSVKVGKVDVDANPGVAERYGIASIPTILVFQGGEIVAKFVGVTPKRAFADTLDKLAA